VLSGLGEIKVCRAYRLGEEGRTQFPLSLENLNRCNPIYETFPGWSERIQNIRSYEGLPEQAKAYLQYLARAVGAPVGMISVGPSPEETIETDFDTP
jgi:adenylosuccinate synthase